MVFEPINRPLQGDQYPQNGQNNFGPLELNILERVEIGLDENDFDNSDAKSNENKSDCEKYEGKKELIF